MQNIFAQIFGASSSKAVFPSSPGACVATDKVAKTDILSYRRLQEARVRHHAWNLSCSEGATAEQQTAFSGSVSRLKDEGYENVRLISNDRLQKRGVYIYALYSTERDLPIQIVCRGTDAGDASIFTDFDPNGPAYCAMVENRKEIFEGSKAENPNLGIQAGLNEVISDSRCKDMEVIGYSLGGAVLQLLLWLISIERLSASSSSSVKELTSLQVLTFQSAPVNEKVARYADENIKALKGQLPIEIVAHQHKLDPANSSGSYIGSTLKPEHARVEVVRNSVGPLAFLRSFFGMSPLPHYARFYSDSESPIQHNLDAPRTQEQINLDDSIAENCRYYFNTDSEGSTRVENYLGQRFFNLSKIFGVFYPILSKFTTPVLRFLGYCYRVLSRALHAALSAAWVVIMPTPAAVWSLVVTSFDFLESVLAMIQYLWCAVRNVKREYIDVKYIAPELINASHYNEGKGAIPAAELSSNADKPKARSASPSVLDWLPSLPFGVL